MIWLLVLTCACGKPVQSRFPTKAACEDAARWEMARHNITVPSYRCSSLKVWS